MRVYVSAYFDTGISEQPKLRSKIKSLAVKALRQSRLTRGKHRLHQVVGEAMEEGLDRIENLGEGLVMFTDFEPEAVDRGHETIDQEDMIIEVLGVRVDDKVTVDKAFLTEIWEKAKNRLAASLLIQLEPENARIYELAGNKLNLLEKVANRIERDRVESGNLDMFRPERDEEIVSSLGADKAERDKLEAARGLLTQLREVLEKINHRKDWRWVVVNYSDYFRNFIQKFREYLEGEKFGKRGVLLINKQIRVQGQLAKITRRKIDRAEAGQDTE